MDNDAVSVQDILAKEGLGSLAFEFETLYPDLESASLTQLLATVIDETHRLQDWHYRSSGQASSAKECQSLAQEASDSLSDGEELDYRHLLIIGYLYGRLTLPEREVKSNLSDLTMSRLAQTSGLESANAEKQKAHEWMRKLAREIWEQDTDKCLRTGEVARRVKKKLEKLKKMLDERGHPGVKHWPLSDKAIRREIKAEAPEYASKGGAPIKHEKK